MSGRVRRDRLTLKVVCSCKLVKMLRACCKCEHFRQLENRLGHCTLFGDTAFARLHKALCTPEGTWFKEARVAGPEPRADPLKGLYHTNTNDFTVKKV